MKLSVSRLAVLHGMLLAAACATNPPVAAPNDMTAAVEVVAPIAPPASVPPVSAPAAAPVGDPVGALIAKKTEAESAAAVAPVAPSLEVRPSVATDTRTLSAYLAALSDVSCPSGIAKRTGATVALAAKPVPLQAINPGRKTVGALTFVGGFHLTSPDTRFGGLSGVDVLDDGNLLAVSDLGNLVWIDLAKDGVTPVAARIGSLQDTAGDALLGKTDGDAEGLAVNGGIALVSFERNHRVLAYDLGKCGAAARGAPIVFGEFGGPLPEAFQAAKIDVSKNAGPEPLAVTPDWMLFTGIETLVDKSGPLSARAIEAPPVFDLRVETDVPEFVGLDVVVDGDRVRAFSMHRSFSPLSGNAITISETDFRRELDQGSLPRRIVSEIDERSHVRFVKTATRRLAEMNILMTIDNFEGIAAKVMPDGQIRLFVISDDNFSASQRTLLLVFDLPA